MKHIRLGEVDSTNTYALRHFRELPDGTLISATSQTSGRGRQGRKWISPPDRNIYISWVLRGVDNPGFLAGLGILYFLREQAPEHEFFLKWPNDVYCRYSKIAGILCEGAEYSGGKVTGAVAGIGININMTPDELAVINQSAVSLRSLTGMEFNLIFLLDSLENSLNSVYIRYSRRPDLLFEAWKKENWLIGKEITVSDSGGIEKCGIFSDVASDGGLILEYPGGGREVFRCGDVSIKKGSWL